MTASTQEMGIVLFGMSVGAFAGVFFSPRFVRSFGTTPIIGFGGWGSLAGLCVIALASHVGYAWLAFSGFVLVGAGMGTLEIGANLQAAALEAILKKSILTTMHGYYSLGMVVGAVTGIAFNAMHIPVEMHLWMITVICIPMCIFALRRIPAKGFDKSSDEPHQSLPFKSLLRDGRLIALGLVVLAAALAEGAANDWLPLILVDGHGFDQTLSAASFAGFASAMAIGRFLGPVVLRYAKKETALRLSVFVSAIGLAIVVLAPWPELAGFAVILWGAGAALAFPLTLSIAGEETNGDVKVGVVAQLGYIAFLVGPPMLGFLGEHYGLRNGMTVVFVALFAASAVTPKAMRYQPARDLSRRLP
ncbi:fucose permease [Rhizobium sp. BK060]|nr:fucose permease [Rhizobium sp. BK060]